MIDRLAVARSRAFTAALVTAVVLVAVLLVIRLVNVRGGRFVVVALALTPYVVGCGVVLSCVCLAVRRGRLAGAALLVTLVLAATLLPRVLPNEQPGAAGAGVRVMSLNLNVGQADAASVVERVRRRDVDVLCLLELTPPAVADLRAAGLFDLLPNHRLRPAPGGSGVGIVSAYPMSRPRSPSDAGYAATVRLPGGDLNVVAVHTLAPLYYPVEQWRNNLRALPPGSTAESDRPRVLVGDFNATLDHAALRELLDSGYVDAAAQVGDGVIPTWPSELFPPPVAIDHVLAQQSIAVRDYAVLDIAGTDHRAVYAELTMPS